MRALLALCVVAVLLAGCKIGGVKPDEASASKETTSAGPSKAETGKAVKQVERLIAEGKLDEASTALDNLRQSAPTDPGVRKASTDLAAKLAQRADVRTTEGKLDEARADAQKARALDPANPQVKSSSVRLSQFYADRAARLLDGQKLSDAEVQVTHALDLDQDNITAKRVGKRIAQAYAIRAANQLDEGKQAEASAGLESALKLDAQNELANLLYRSIVDDPVQELGTKHFEYKVKPGDTLSRISEQFLKEQYRFFLLARYNGISVPRSLKVGQVIKVPGTKPKEPPQATPPPPPLPPTPKEPGPVAPDASARATAVYADCKSEAKAGNKERAYALCREASRLNPKDKQIQQDTERLRQDVLQSLDRKAREAYRRQDLDGCIASWDRYLELAPGAESAKIERDRCERLKGAIEMVGTR